MRHRHLNHERYTPAAIDDIIARGRRVDWAALRQAILDDPRLLDIVDRICQSRVADPYAQRYHFWMHYVQVRRSA